MNGLDEIREIPNQLRELLPEKVDYGKLVGAESYTYGCYYVWEDPEPYVMDKAACAIEELLRRLEDKETVMNAWVSVGDRLPDVEEKIEPVYDMDTLAEVDARCHMVSELVLVTVIDENNKQFVCDDILVDGKWVNFPFPEWEITHWMPLPKPAT